MAVARFGTHVSLTTAVLDKAVQRAAATKAAENKEQRKAVNLSIWLIHSHLESPLTESRPHNHVQIDVTYRIGGAYLGVAHYPVLYFMDLAYNRQILRLDQIR